ncbi:MAG: STAS/SEC14 domain-containing protein [Rugosibacter sp.]
MIAIDHNEKLVKIALLGEFTLADFKEFEELVQYKIRFTGPVNLLIDFRQMLTTTLDVAWQEVRFTREHTHDFHRIAIVTNSQWVTWSAWLSQLFVDAQLELFEEETPALVWLTEETSVSTAT